MPVVSQFYGIVVTMHFDEGARHNMPHLHALYAEFDAVFDFDGNILQGEFPIKQRKMLEAWIILHKEELNSLWITIRNHDSFFKIDPLH